MISVGKALKTILASARLMGTEKINILDAQRRAIAENIYAGRDIPSVDNSAMDGYALRAADTKGATPKKPVWFKIIEEIPAGKIPRKKLRSKEAARIMTGAIIPGGADAVIRQENTRREGNLVAVLTPVARKTDIRFAGEDVRKGELVIHKNSVLGAAQIGMLAALGKKSVLVYKKPRVAIMATGDELVDIDTNPSPGKIVNSNSYSLATLVDDCGGVPVILGITRDNKSALKQKFSTALKNDVIISSGGVSVGDYDLVKDIMVNMGNSMYFWQVAMRPGKPLAFGAIKGVPLFGLPGNPVSTMVSFEQFVRPYLLKIQGHRNIFRPVLKAISAENLEKKAGVKNFLRAIVKREKDKYIVKTTGNQGSGILKSMVTANALIILGEKETKIKKGDKVTVQLLDDSLFKTDSFLSV
ncbi:MAG TPA: molybdopterin molybdotransferase MoeA [Smithellaceae bacterium]|nr:molybdopterin molybdotransferase MoeA [Smithellaceae bacterium]HNT91230.1 molybdopterin molybdotransferase MoeA [Smithellaceae bacterium]HNV65085.1 molybdopterin molybdotransferase MoeA [Smithellaceae bacterium]HNZ31805.1 molybdopterin molybdotransferase MoeA [Smithellaceae bacterium]HOD30984.1 molybdopterin molybdotransferase MoeA [Smithellaceae bacterium]